MTFNPNTESVDYDIAVIGLGPTGATLANLLGLCGLRVVVLERAREIHDLPRAVHFDGEVMRVFQTIGVADEVAATSRVNAGMRFVDARDRLILDWPRPQDVGPQGWYPSYRFHQPDLEAILRRRLEDFPNVDVRLGQEASLVRQANRVHLCTADGTRLTAHYAVGCDGGRSSLRPRIGGGTQDLGFHERWLVIDVLLDGDRPDLGDYTIQYCHPQNPATYVRGPGLRRRWEIAIGNQPDGEVLMQEAIWRRLARWITPDEAEIERAAIYTFHSTIAERWRNHRLLIAGDAAHQTPPFMGQGMCAGIRDAANLAWKLAACVRYGHDDRLLDSYQSERHPNVRAFIEGAVALGRLVNAADRGGALKSALRQSDGSYRMATIAPPLGPGLARRGCPDAGRLIAQPVLADGTRADDAVGYAPALLSAGALPGAARKAAESAGLVVLTAVDHPDVARHLDDLGTRAALVRPDRYLLGTAETYTQLIGLIGVARSGFVSGAKFAEGTPR